MEKDWYVSFEVAKLAKDNGFNLWEYCDSGYHPHDGTVIDMAWPVLRKNFPNESLGRPHQWLVQKWLREYKARHVTVLYSVYDSSYSYQVKDTDNTKYFESVSGVKCSYEEALEEALLAALS